MNIITQEAKKKQAIVKYALRKGKSEASRVYGVSLSSVKRWCKQYDGTWQSLLPKSRRPHSHPNRHTKEKKDKLEILLKSAMKDMDGMEYTVI
ncbi:helix-turn-helix domain-containing protein [Ruminococcus bovis]|uniref:Helix-turn-helix domain-containing protein n=1 Tax=Ruminococcus bovis TaxID=2564099 RepID=A0A4P8XV54_9FIRM|nr:helix-turn-helix domain-containing protein [Ruminococcus bovis]QCT06284.1 helix-turn-helix domain-containing protein [Ruminococcus bovis]